MTHHETKKVGVSVRKDLLELHEEHEEHSLSQLINTLLQGYFDTLLYEQKDDNDDLQKHNTHG